MSNEKKKDKKLNKAQKNEDLKKIFKPSKELKDLAKDKLPELDYEEVANDMMYRLFGVYKLELRKLPITTASKPSSIDISDMAILNSPLRGTLKSQDEDSDTVINGLRLAEAANMSALMITGNIMWMLTQRYGIQRAYKSQVSGVEIDLEMLEKDTPKIVKKSKKYKTAEDRHKSGEPFFLTPKQRLDNAIKNLHKTFVDSKGHPYYSRPVLINFGKMEEDLIMFHVNEYLRIFLFSWRAKWQKTVNDLTAKCRNENPSPKKTKLWNELIELKRWVAQATLTNMSDQSIAKARQMVTGYIINKYEEAIPNSRVVSVGDAFIKPSSKLVMSTTNKDRETYAGKLSTILCQKTEGYSKARKPGNIPNVMIGHGLNPYMDVKLVTYQASSEVADKRMCMILQMPVSFDAEKYRDVIRGQNTLKDILTRVARKGGFESGMVHLKWVKGVPLPLVSTWTSSCLRNKNIFGNEKSLKDFVEAKKPEYKFIYFHKKGCTHAGASDIVLYSSPDNPSHMCDLYHHQIEREFLLSTKAPIHMYMHDGDATQGYNHDYQKNVHPEDKLPQEYRKELIRIKRNSNLSPEDKIRELMRMAFRQRVRSGVLMPQDQVKEYVDSLEIGLDYFFNILKNGKKAKLTFDGPLSLLLTIMGNHNANTFKNSKIIHSDAREINALLRNKLFEHLINLIISELKAIKSLNELPALVDRLIVICEGIATQLTAPQYGPLGEARGCLRINGKKAYSIVLKHKQGKMDKTQERAYRRSIKNTEIGLPVLNNSGDDHKGGIRITRDMLNVKTGCEQGEGSFGRQIDGSEQNVFSVVYSVPVGGFDCGPIRFMILDTEMMRKYALKPFPVDGKELFPHPFEG